MKKFQIWSEGFETNGNSAQACFHGEGKGETFREACENFADMHPEFAKYFNPHHMAYWGCALFDNEEDARKSFG